MISVITVTRNSAATLAETIESVLSQDYRPLEYILIDGASTDATLEIVRSYGQQISRVISEPDSGIYDAMNKGLAVSTGSSVLFINSDDVFTGSGALSSLMRARQACGGTTPVVCYSDFLKYYPSLDRSLLVKAADTLEKGFTLCHQAMLTDKDAYDIVGPFDASFRFAGDHDWAARAKRLGVTFIKAPVAPTVIFRHGGVSHQSYWQSRMEGGRVVLREYGRIAHLRYTARQIWVRFLRSVSTHLTRFMGARRVAQLQETYFRLIRKHQAHDVGRRR
jgi:glycosyltransferase